MVLGGATPSTAHLTDQSIADHVINRAALQSGCASSDRFACILQRTGVNTFGKIGW
jgi:hypothetical protein